MENELEKTLGVLSEASLRRSTMNSVRRSWARMGTSYSLVTARKLSALLGRSGSCTSRYHTGVMKSVSRKTTTRRMRRYEPTSGGK